jgi:hypothetical protein
MATKKITARVTQLLWILFSLLILYVVSRAAAGQWKEISEQLTTFRTQDLWVSFLLHALSYFLLVEGWILTLGISGARLPLKEAFTIFSFAQLARYIPGSVFAYASRVHLAKKEEVSRTHTVVSLAFETGLLLGSAAVVSLFTLSHALSPSILLGLVVVTIAVVVAFEPQLFGWFVNLARKKLIGEEVKLHYSHIDLLKASIPYFLHWIVFGVALFAVVRSIVPIPVSTLPFIIGINAFSWFVGYLAPGAPAGLGIREAAIALLLQRLMPLPTATVIAILSRVVAIVAEMATLAAIKLLALKEKNAS